MSWPMVALGDVCDLENGDRGKNYPSKSTIVETGVPFVNAGDLSAGGLNNDDLSFISEDHYARLSNGKFEQGDFLFCLRGTLGKFGFVDRPMRGAIASSLIIIRPREQIHASFFNAYLGSSLCLEQINLYKNGAAQPNLAAASLKQFKIPLPPLEEQKRIAGILDQADALRRLRTRALDKLNTLGQAIFHEMFGAEAKTSIACRSQSIKDFCDVSSGSTPSRKTADYYSGTIPWVKTGEVNGRTITETEECVSDAGRESARLKVYPVGTVLIAMYGQGKTRGQVGILGIQATTNQACAALTPKKDILPEFLFYQLRSSYERLRDQGRGGNQPNLNAGMVKDFPIFVPDLKRQAHFVMRIQRAEKQAEEFHASKSKLAFLFASLQHRAFRGDL